MMPSSRQTRSAHAALALIVLLSLGAALALTRLKVETDLSALLPSGSPVADAYQTYLERFGGFEKVFVLITPADDTVTIDEMEREDLAADLLSTARLLTEQLRDSPEIAAVRAGLEPEDERFFLRQVLPRTPLLLGEDWRQQIAPRLAPEAIQRRVARLRAMLKTPAGEFQRQLAIHDPLGWSEDLGQTGPFALPVDLLSSGFLAAEGNASLVMITPAGAEIDPESGQRLRAAIDEAAARAQAEITRPLEFGAVGGPLYAAYDEELLRRDLQKTVTGSLTLCTLLLIAAFAGWRLPAICVGILLLGLLWTAGWLGLFVERISAVGLGFAAVLVGLGIDYAIHGGARFRQARLAGLEPVTALEEARQHAGPAILASALTTAAAFSTLLLAHFRPLHEIGMLVAGGILTLLVATFLLTLILPSMLAKRTASPPPRSSLVWNWLERLTEGSINTARRYPWWVLASALLLTLVSAQGAADLRIDPDLRALRPAGHPLTQIEEQLAHFFDLGADTATLIVHDEDPNLAFEKAGRVTTLLRQNLADQASLTSPADWVTSKHRIEDRLTALGELPFAESTARLEAELRRANLNPTAFAAGLETMRAYAEGRDPAAQLAEASPGWLAELIREDEDGTWLALRLRLNQGVWEQGPPATIMQSVEQVAPGTQWASAPLLGSELRQVATDDARRLDLFAILGVLVVVLLAFRGRPRPALLALLPVVLGSLWTLGLWGASGRPLDLLSLSVLPILLGIGVDDGLHAVHGTWRTRQADALAENIRQAGRAMTLTTLTTMAGFGSLTLSQVPGLRSGGQLVAFGVLCCWFTTLWVLPALEAALMQNRPPKNN